MKPLKTEVAFATPWFEVLSYSLPELARATAEGEFNHALLVAVLLVAMMKGKMSLAVPG